MVARVVPVDPFDLIVLGGTGDLARRKLIPALYHRMHDGQIPPGSRIIGAARGDLDTDAFRRLADAALEEFVGAEALEPDTRASFLAAIDFVHLDATSDVGWMELETRLAGGQDRIRAFYLSVAPRLFGPIAEKIHGHGLATRDARIVVEKPLGHDLTSARELNAALARHFDEAKIES